MDGACVIPPMDSSCDFNAVLGSHLGANARVDRFRQVSPFSRAV